MTGIKSCRARCFSEETSVQMWKKAIGQDGAAIKQPLNPKATISSIKKTKNKCKTNDNDHIKLVALKMKGEKKKHPVSR